MIYFITPLSAKSAVSNWELTTGLLRQTLNTLKNQTSHNFRSIVCCHDVPEFSRELDDRFRFVIHPFDPPDKALSIDGVNSGARDMMLKRDVALYHANPGPDDFVMLLDADDLLHRDLVRDVEMNKGFDAVTLDHGYEMCFKSNRLLARSNMVDKCTSTFLLKGHLVSSPESLSENDLVKSLYHSVWHSNLYAYLKDHKIPTKRLGEARVVYLVNTSLNISDVFRRGVLKSMKQDIKFRFGRRVNDDDRFEFSML